MELTSTQYVKITGSDFLITGGAGFIGSHIAEFLLHAGAQKVRVLDNLTTGNFRNVASFANHRNFEFLKGDVCNLDTCKAACKGINYAIHQAALESAPRSMIDPATTNHVNTGGFLNMLVAARDAGANRFIYASSSSIYGDSTELPQTETMSGKPLSPYAVAKYNNELYADLFTRLYGMETIGLRYFNVFGLRQDPNSVFAAVIPKFILQLMRGESPVINGNGEYTRDFTYVDNVVQANILAALTPDAQAINQVYNIACGKQTSLNELAAYLKEFLGELDESIASTLFIHAPERPGDIPHSVASIEKAKQLLNYNPLCALRKGLKKTVDWYWVNQQQFQLCAEERALANLTYSLV